MLILLAAAALSAQNPVAGDRSPLAVPAQCRPGADKAAAAGPARSRKLGEMPPAQQIKTVWRFDERGCPVPVVVRPKVGGDGR